jgi:hypothetical protein
MDSLAHLIGKELHEWVYISCQCRFANLTIALGHFFVQKMHTAIPQNNLQMHLFKKNEKSWADKGQAIENWKDEVETWEANPQKWLAEDANPYHRQGCRNFPFLFLGRTLSA